MAGRTLFQMDKTTPEDQIFFRYLRECRQESDLDRHSVYVLALIIKKQLDIKADLYTILQI